MDRLKEMENYKNGILYSIIFGKIFLRHQKIFNLIFSKYLIYLLLFILVLSVIFPIEIAILDIIRLSVSFLFGISIFFAVIYLLNYFASKFFRSIPLMKLIYFKNVNTIFYSVLFVANIFYILDVLRRSESFRLLGFKYDIFNIAFYSAVVELSIISLFIFSKIMIKTLFKAKNSMFEYYYKNYKNMSQHKKNEIFSILISSTKEIRLCLIVLIGFIILKFMLFYRLEIYQYRVKHLPKSEINLVLGDFINWKI